MGVLVVSAGLKAGADMASAGTSATDRYNSALEFISVGDVEKAKSAFEELVKDSSGEALRRSHYNLGNILAAAGQLDEATRHYEAALAMNSQDQQVRDNLEWAKRKKESQNKEQNNN